MLHGARAVTGQVARVPALALPAHRSCMPAACTLCCTAFWCVICAGWVVLCRCDLPHKHADEPEPFQQCLDLGLVPVLLIGWVRWASATRSPRSRQSVRPGGTTTATTATATVTTRPAVALRPQAGSSRGICLASQATLREVRAMDALGVPASSSSCSVLLGGALRSWLGLVWCGAVRGSGNARALRNHRGLDGQHQGGILPRAHACTRPIAPLLTCTMRMLLHAGEEDEFLSCRDDFSIAEGGRSCCATVRSPCLLGCMCRAALQRVESTPPPHRGYRRLHHLHHLLSPAPCAQRRPAAPVRTRPSGAPFRSCPG